MADITPVTNRPVSGVTTATWDSITEADTPLGFKAAGAAFLNANMSVSGTFGGASVKFQTSNDNLNWYDIENAAGTVVTFTASKAFDFTTAMVYIRPVITGGTGQDLKVVGAFRG